MTGIEAVSNGVPLFREPRVREAQRTLFTIAVVLSMLLAGIALLCRAYGISATPQGEHGYQSVLSQLIAAAVGRGVFYYISMGAVLTVLCLSANTSFADFPRLSRLLALDEFLPEGFAQPGRRLVYSNGIVVLSVLAGSLLIAFRGITEKLIPLFAVGAFAAFTLSQFGMVAHWRRQERRNRASEFVNALGGTCTALTLLIVIASKFSEGAWISLFVILLLVVLFASVRHHQQREEAETLTQEPLPVEGLQHPIVVIPLRRLDRIARKALRFALEISPDVYAVQVLRDDPKQEDMAAVWSKLVEKPARDAGLPIPKLVVLRSPYRELFDPLLKFLRSLEQPRPNRYITVIVPELVERRWYHYILHTHHATALKLFLLFQRDPQIVVINTPWYLKK